MSVERGSVPLNEDRIGQRHFDELLDGAEHRVTREQHERAAVRAAEDLDDFARRRFGKSRRFRRGHAARQVEQRLCRVVELGSHANVVDFRIPSRPLT